MEHKLAYLVILCCVLIHMSVIGSDAVLYHTAHEDGALVYLVSEAVAYLLYPLLGWMADVHFTRYKFVKFSFIIMIVVTILMITVIFLFLHFYNVRALFYLGGLSILIGIFAIWLFESTAIQFGMDQMLETSSDKLSTFIHWYYWSCNLGQLVILYIELGTLTYFTQCIIELHTPHTTDL